MDGPFGRLLIAAEQRGIPLAQQVLGHGALVLCREEGPFQMDAQQPGPGDGRRHGLFGLADAPEGLLLGIGQDAALPAGGAVAGKERADPGQVRRGGGVDVDAVPAVGVQVNKAGDQRHPLQVHHLAARRGGQMRADAVDDAAADQHVGRRKGMVAVDAGILIQNIRHAVHPPQYGCLAATSFT